MNNIAIFGLGYIGTVMGAILAEKGYQVTGIDIQAAKVDLINKGQSPIVEPGLAELIRKHNPESGTGNFSAVANYQEVKDADLLFVCVGTPSDEKGAVELKCLKKVLSEIKTLLASATTLRTVVIRSTIPPGTITNVVAPVLESLENYTIGDNLHILFNPEFLREGCAVKDFYKPPKTVIGCYASSRPDFLREIYDSFNLPVTITDIGVSEMIKYVDNSYHALKVAFANEIGSVCHHLDIDSRKVMDLFKVDHKLNISEKYFNPGLPFGGSCLPKDVRGLSYISQVAGIKLPIIQNLLNSNNNIKEHLYSLLKPYRSSKIALLGITFKPDTDDLRESPLVDLAEHLLGKGYKLSVYDPNLEMARLIGANKSFIEDKIPHLIKILVADVEQLIAENDVFLVSHATADTSHILEKLPDNKIIMDMANIELRFQERTNYYGLWW